MLKIKAAHFVELFLMLVAIVVATLYFQQLNNQHDTITLLKPHHVGQTLKENWKILGMGFPDGNKEKLVIQLISPDYPNPAFIYLTPNKDKKCRKICSKNFEISILFNLRTENDPSSSLQIEGIPNSLKQSYQSLTQSIIHNDIFQNPEKVLNQKWDIVTIKKDMQNWQTYLQPKQDLDILLSYFLMIFAFCWLVIFIASFQGRYTEILLVSLITGCALYLRLIGSTETFLSDAPLQRMAYALQPILDILLSNTPELNHPPLTFLILKADIFIFGMDEFFVRLPFILAGTLSVPAVYWLAKILSSKKVGIVAALIIAFNPIHRELSLMINDFILLGLFGTLATYFYLRHIKQNNLKSTLLFCLFAILTIHSSMIGIVWIFALFLVFLSKKVRLKQNSRAKWSVWLIILIASIPMLILIFKAFSGMMELQQKLSMIPELAWGTEPLLQQAFNIAIDLLDPPLGLFFATLLIFGFLSINLNTIRRRHFAPITIPLITLSIVLILLAVVSRVRSDYFYFMMVLLAPIAAVAILRLTQFRENEFAESFFRISAAAITALVLISSVESADNLLTTSEQPKEKQIETILDKLYFQQAGMTKTLITPSNLGMLANYHFCKNLDLWQDREGKVFHDCLPDLKLYTMGMPYTFKGKHPGAINSELQSVISQKPYYLFIGKYSSTELNNWAKRYCKPLAVEQDFALMKCR